jgi:tetratricopeptide (TPR) repeat protein
MDISNPVIKLCLEGSRAELEGRIQSARDLYLQAWNKSQNDYEACIAAHYVARYQENAEDALWWNHESLKCANRANKERVKEFFPSLYLNMGRSHEILGNRSEAQRYYDLAAEQGFQHLAK